MEHEYSRQFCELLLHEHSEDQANVIYSQLTPQLKRCVDLAKERGASSWLSVLPLSEQGFHAREYV